MEYEVKHESRRQSADKEVFFDNSSELVKNGHENPNGKEPSSFNIGDGVIKKPLPINDNHHDRVKKKAKRLTRLNSRGNSVGNGVGTNTSSSTEENGLPINNVNNYVVPQRRWKNSRRSRNSYGRGLPKKGGAGGKGVWGKLGSELLEVEYEDHNDPNYDSETNDRNIELREVIPELSPEDFFKMSEPIILEYYEHGDTHEVAVLLDEILTGQLRPYVTAVAIEISMDHKDSHREMTSVLLSDLYGRVITGKDFTKGFDMLLENLPDLQLDTPEAPTILGNYLARAVADDCIPPKYITKPEDLEALNEYGLTAIKRADTLLHLKQGSLAHLDNVWGMGGPLRPVKCITKQMALLLQEYLSSRDIQEAHRCLRDLEVPHYYHELVYEAIVMTLESLSQNTEDAMCELLMSLEKTCIISPAMFEQVKYTYLFICFKNQLYMIRVSNDFSKTWQTLY
ncbi:PDCD4 family protein [Megaselia abdita]